MHVRRVVPEGRELVGRAVEDDPPSHEEESRHDMLDGSELVRDVEDRDAELGAELGEQDGERLLGLRVDTRRRLVEREEQRLGRERLGDEGALLQAARQRAQRRVGSVAQADALDRTRDGLAGRRRGADRTAPAPRGARPRRAPGP